MAAPPATASSASTPTTTEGSAGTGFTDALALLKRKDIYFALSVMGILTVLLVPVPPGLLDGLLAISITLSVLILMTVLFIEKHLDLSAFPTILLITAMLRLSLNIASTRLILSEGHQGTDAAGNIIQAFGQFVMSGEVIIGVIVFGILTIINFVVITKGAGRIAEVSARFSLDAMPGKQMAIDADLSAGLIDEITAKSRRKELEDESTFFGAMDGASKFVRGDAIAGLMITFINLVGGLMIGVVQRDMSFADALQTYTILTIGDGLVSQIPAIIVSTAAGLLVSKSAASGSTEKAVLDQLSIPSALGMSSIVLVMFGFAPGIPMPPFFTLAALVGFMGWYSYRNRREHAVQEAGMLAEQEQPAAPKEESISDSLHIDALRLELGYGLLPLINYQKGHRLTEQIKALRRQIARDLGFVMPPVRIQDNMQLPANTYVVRLKDIEAARGEVRPEMLMVMNPAGGKISLPGEETTEPAFGLPAMWIAESYREEALFKNYTVVDPPTVITTHLTEIIRQHMNELLSYSETQKLLDEMKDEHQQLVADTIPGQISLNSVQRVLQNLLIEQISIRDMPTIVEAISEASRATQNIMLITEHVRSRLARQICHAVTNEDGHIPIVAMSAAWEQVFAESLTGGGEERQLAMPPSKIQDFITKVRGSFDQFAMKGQNPVLLTSPLIRPYVRSIVERFRPETMVISQNEIHARAKIKTLGHI